MQIVNFQEEDEDHFKMDLIWSFKVLDQWSKYCSYLGACLHIEITKMKITDQDNLGGFDEHTSDGNDGNDEATFDSGEREPINTLLERPLLVLLH